MLRLEVLPRGLRMRQLFAALREHVISVLEPAHEEDASPPAIATSVSALRSGISIELLVFVAHAIESSVGSLGTKRSGVVAHLHPRVDREVCPEKVGAQVSLPHPLPPDFLDPRRCILSGDLLELVLWTGLAEGLFECLHVNLALGTHAASLATVKSPTSSHDVIATLLQPNVNSIPSPSMHVRRHATYWTTRAEGKRWSSGDIGSRTLYMQIFGYNVESMHSSHIPNTIKVLHGVCCRDIRDVLGQRQRRVMVL